MAGIGDPQIAVWTVSADIKLDALGQRKIVAEIDGAGDPPHVRLPSVGPGMLITALSDFEGTMLFVSHDRHFLSVLSNRVPELTPEGIHQYGGGYTEYVARTGQEAPMGCTSDHGGISLG